MLSYRSDRGFAIVWFSEVIDHRLSPVNDEGIGKHPYAKAGLQFYSFHEIIGSEEAVRWSAINGRHWVVTFKDNTLDVIAERVNVLARDLPGSNPTTVLFWYLQRGLA